MSNVEKAMEILSEELKKETSHYMNRCILKHLLKRVQESETLADEVSQEHKSFDKCMKYVYQAAYDKMALGVKDGNIDADKCVKISNGAFAYGEQLDDQFTYDAAEDYYHVDDYEQWKSQKDAEEKKKAEADKKKAKSDVTSKETAKKKAIKAMNDAAKKLATDPQNEDLAAEYAKTIEAVDKATADYDAAKAEYDEKYPESENEKKADTKTTPKRGRKAKKTAIEENATEKSTEITQEKTNENLSVETASPDVPAEEPVAKDSETDEHESAENETSGKIVPFTHETKTQKVENPETTTMTVTDYSKAILYVAFKDRNDLLSKEDLLLEMISKNSGSNEVYAYISTPKGQKKMNCTISLDDHVVDSLKNMFGGKNVFCARTSTKEVAVSAEPLKEAN